ncbi:MAG: hypothetical protein WB579_16495 [Bryobacteraceae bacterium]
MLDDRHWLCRPALIVFHIFGRPCAALACLRAVSPAALVHAAARLCKALAGYVQRAWHGFKSFFAPIRAALALAGRGGLAFSGFAPLTSASCGLIHKNK